MTTFAKSGFNAISYASFRPSYPPKLYTTILSYHRGSTSTLLDLGCGHGLISREFSPHFNAVIATDPSPSMISQAQSSTLQTHKNITFRQVPAEDLSFIDDDSLDMVVAGQAAHWFDYTKVWPELRKKVRAGGTLAFWGYSDNILVDNPRATQILDHYCYDPETMGPMWEQPGRQILRDGLRAIKPPEHDWEAVERIEYEPGVEGKGSGKGEVLMHKRMRLGDVENYTRTFSSYHNWMDEHTEVKAKKDGGNGDIVDEMFERMLEAEPEWKEAGEGWRDVEVENEWRSTILLARRRGPDSS